MVLQAIIDWLEDLKSTSQKDIDAFITAQTNLVNNPAGGGNQPIGDDYKKYRRYARWINNEVQAKVAGIQLLMDLELECTTTPKQITVADPQNAAPVPPVGMFQFFVNWINPGVNVQVNQAQSRPIRFEQDFVNKATEVNTVATDPARFTEQTTRGNALSQLQALNAIHTNANNDTPFTFRKVYNVFVKDCEKKINKIKAINYFFHVFLLGLNTILIKICSETMALRASYKSEPNLTPISVYLYYASVWGMTVGFLNLVAVIIWGYKVSYRKKLTDIATFKLLDNPLWQYMSIFFTIIFCSWIIQTFRNSEIAQEQEIVKWTLSLLVFCVVFFAIVYFHSVNVSRKSLAKERLEATLDAAAGLIGQPFDVPNVAASVTINAFATGANAAEYQALFKHKLNEQLSKRVNLRPAVVEALTYACAGQNDDLGRGFGQAMLPGGNIAGSPGLVPAPPVVAAGGAGAPVNVDCSEATKKALADKIVKSVEDTYGWKEISKGKGKKWYSLPRIETERPTVKTVVKPLGYGAWALRKPEEAPIRKIRKFVVRYP